MKTVIFDLDGTLIDSAESILAGLSFVANKFGFLPLQPLDHSLIGPPLVETLCKLLGPSAKEQLDTLAFEFKNFYDLDGYKQSMAYPGIDALLWSLHHAGAPLYLATNKRYAPTEKILEHFGWTNLFSAVYSIDRNSDQPYVNKTSMIGALLKEQSIKPEDAVYIGDRIEDWTASLDNALTSILVGWGYGDYSSINFANVPVARSVDVLFEMLKEQR